MKRLVSYLLMFCVIGSGSIATAADYQFLVKDGKYFLVNQGDPTQPNKAVTVQFTYLNGGPTVPPLDPPTTPVGLQAIAGKLITDAIKAGGTSTTAAAISSVYSVVADSVSEGKTKPEDALPAVKFLLSGLLPTQADAAKWTVFQDELGKAFDTLRQNGVLSTKDQYVKAFKDVSAGINAAIGFNGSLTDPDQTIDPNSGILDKIDLTKLMELIKFLLELWKAFKT